MNITKGKYLCIPNTNTHIWVVCCIVSKMYSFNLNVYTTGTFPLWLVGTGGLSWVSSFVILYSTNIGMRYEVWGMRMLLKSVHTHTQTHTDTHTCGLSWAICVPVSCKSIEDKPIRELLKWKRDRMIVKGMKLFYTQLTAHSQCVEISSKRVSSSWVCRFSILCSCECKTVWIDNRQQQQQEQQQQQHVACV